MSMPSEPSQRFDGRYGDGRTAASEPVTVTMTAHGIEVVRLDGAAAGFWPYAELATSTLLGKRSSDVVVRHVAAAGQLAPPVAGASADYGATVFIAGPAFAAALARAAPHLTARNEFGRFAKLGLMIFLPLVLTIGIVWATIDQPAREIARMMPERWWKRIGDQVVAGLGEGRRACSTPAGNAAIGRLMRKLSAAAGTSEPFDVRVVDWELLNAFAAPGRQIVVTRELLAKVGNSDELAGVLAHEMGHALELHPEAGLVRGLGLMAVFKVLFAGGGETVSNIGLLLLQLRYTRDAERQADQRAVAIMREARIPATALGDFFGRLKRLDGERGNKRSAVDIFSTHPSLDERLDTLRRLPSYPTEPSAPASDLAAMRSMCAG